MSGERYKAIAVYRADGSGVYLYVGHIPERKSVALALVDGGRFTVIGYLSDIESAEKLESFFRSLNLDMFGDK